MRNNDPCSSLILSQNNNMVRFVIILDYTLNFDKISHFSVVIVEIILKLCSIFMLNNTDAGVDKKQR